MFCSANREQEGTEFTHRLVEIDVNPGDQPEKMGDKKRVQADSPLEQRIEPEGFLDAVRPLSEEMASESEPRHEGSEHRADGIDRDPHDQVEFLGPHDLVDQAACA